MPAFGHEASFKLSTTLGLGLVPTPTTGPQGVDLSDPEAAAKNEESLAVCEQVEEHWVRMITNTLQQEAQRQPQGVWWLQCSAMRCTHFQSPNGVASAVPCKSLMDEGVLCCGLAKHIKLPIVSTCQQFFAAQGGARSRSSRSGRSAALCTAASTSS
jgi:hypothetical protein